MRISPHWDQQARKCASLVIAGRPRYEKIQQRCGVPWYIVGLLHLLECSCAWNKHLHNGDPLTRRTVRVPKGRPVGGKPPFTWEDSALDALDYDGLTKVTDWELPDGGPNIARIAYCFERYNGFGYRPRGIPSPYLWSGTQHYKSGKFTSDGVFSTSAVSKQLGTMPVLWYILTTPKTVVPKPEKTGLLESIMRKFFPIVMAGAVLVAGASGAFAADASVAVQIPIGDLAAQLAGTLAGAVTQVLLWFVLIISAKLPGPIASFIKAQLTEQLLSRAVDYGVNAVEGATKGKVLDVNTGNAVLNEALAYAVTQGAPWLIKWLGGPSGLVHRLVARIPLDETVSSDALGVNRVGG